jgi:phospholipase/carboxylesterase
MVTPARPLTVLAVLAAALSVAALLGCASPTPPAAPVLAPPTPASAAKAEPLIFKEYTVGTTEPEGLLVALHYSSATPEMWDDLVTDWGAPVRVLLPRGPWPRRDGFTWVPADHEDKDLAGKTADIEAMAERIAALIDQVRRQHPTIRRVAVTGFSYGGDLAWMLAIRHPELIDLAVPMGSRLLGDPARALPATTRVHVLHGEVDAIIDAAGTSRRVAELAAHGHAVDIKLYPGLGHDMSAALIADWRALLRAGLAGSAAAGQR